MIAGRPTAARAVLVAAAAAVAVGALGGTLTDLGPWYRNLVKPAWQPPDLAFPIIWTAIFALCAISGLIAWRAGDPRRGRAWIIGLFALNGFLNLLWSLLFFRLHRPDWSLEEVASLWLSVVFLIVALGRRSRLAGLLLTPYLVWVSVAAALNYEVLRLNPPFGG